MRAERDEAVHARAAAEDELKSAGAAAEGWVKGDSLNPKKNNHKQAKTLKEGFKNG